MSKEKIHTGYVKTTSGRYLVQAPDPSSRWGFVIATDDTTYDGGFHVGEDWEAVEEKDVPQSVRLQLQWVLDELKAGAA